jgi:uncharacterized protein YggE
MNQKGLKIEKDCLTKLFLTVIIFFFIFVTVFVTVNIINEIKRGRYIGQEIERQNTISVSASGEIYVRPDLAKVTFTVTNEAKTVTEAMEENTKRMNDVIKYVKEEGVKDEDLKTTSFNIYPRYEYVRDWEIEIYPPPTGKRVLVGYQITQSLQVKIRDMTKIGSIIQAATESGANQMSNLVFVVDKEDEFKKQARTQAITEAKEKANELASQLGVKLVRITNFQESGTIPRFYEYDKAMGLGGEEIPQIETGQNLIKVTVTITYEIN